MKKIKQFVQWLLLESTLKKIILILIIIVLAMIIRVIMFGTFQVSHSGSLDVDIANQVPGRAILPFHIDIDN